MLKVLAFLKRRTEFTLPAFSEYWRTVHKAHALKLVEAGFIRGYIQNHRICDDADGDLPGLPRLADGSPEVWVDDANALARLSRAANTSTAQAPTRRTSRCHR